MYLIYKLYIIILLQNSESGLYNTFMKSFKDQLVEKGRKDFWQEIVTREFPETSLVKFYFASKMFNFLPIS